MLDSFTLTRKVVAMEVFEISNPARLLQRVFPSLRENVVGFLGSFSANEPAIALTGKEREFFARLKKHNYLDIGELSAYVPEGLVTPYLEYLEVGLVQSAFHAASCQTSILDPYVAFLHQLITNENAQLASVSFSRIYKQLERERETMNAAIGKQFKNGSTATVTTLNKVVRRLADWETVFTQLRLGTEKIGSVNRTALSKQAQEIAELMDTLNTKINRGELNRVSPHVVQTITEGAYQAARELEFFSVTYYRLEALAAAINQTTEHISRALKD